MLNGYSAQPSPPSSVSVSDNKFINGTFSGHKNVTPTLSWIFNREPRPHFFFGGGGSWGLKSARTVQCSEPVELWLLKRQGPPSGRAGKAPKAGNKNIGSSLPPTCSRKVEMVIQNTKGIFLQVLKWIWDVHVCEQNPALWRSNLKKKSTHTQT